MRELFAEAPLAKARTALLFGRPWKTGAIVFFFLMCIGGRAQEETDTPAPTRRAALEGFTYSGKPAAIPRRSADGSAAHGELSGDSISMEKVVITTHRLPSYLPPRAETEKPKSGESHSKLGTGVHVKDFGKIRAYSVTVLYIPILVGFSW